MEFRFQPGNVPLHDNRIIAVAPDPDPDAPAGEIPAEQSRDLIVVDRVPLR